MAEVVEQLPSKHESLSTNPSTIKKTKENMTKALTWLGIFILLTTLGNLYFP